MPRSSARHCATVRGRTATRKLLRGARAAARDRLHVLHHLARDHPNPSHLRAHLLRGQALHGCDGRGGRAGVHERGCDHRREHAAVYGDGHRVPSLLRAQLAAGDLLPLDLRDDDGESLATPHITL